MNVDVRFFASLREATGTAALTLSLPEGAGLDDVFGALEQCLPASGVQALKSENVRLARNQDLVTGTLRLAAGDELAFLPPVTGG